VLGLWFKWYNICLASRRPLVQKSLPPKKKKKEKNQSEKDNPIEK
jgi:hypothetical protein